MYYNFLKALASPVLFTVLASLVVLFYRPLSYKEKRVFAFTALKATESYGNIKKVLESLRFCWNL